MTVQCLSNSRSTVSPISTVTTLSRCAKPTWTPLADDLDAAVSEHPPLHPHTASVGALRPASWAQMPRRHRIGTDARPPLGSPEGEPQSPGGYTPRTDGGHVAQSGTKAVVSAVAPTRCLGVLYSPMHANPLDYVPQVSPVHRKQPSTTPDQ
jgi:hypothetical protein